MVTLLKLIFVTFFYALKATNKTQNIGHIKKKWADSCLKILNVELIQIGNPSDLNQLFLVGNHLSFVDILIVVSSHPRSAFLAKSEVENWPAVGWGAKKIGCLFVKRDSKENRSDIRDKIQTLAKNANNLFSFVVFPSGTTCLNEDKKWKKGIFEIAQAAKVPVQNFRITYSAIRQCAYIDDDSLLFTIKNIKKISPVQAWIQWGSCDLIDSVPEQIEMMQNWSNAYKLNDYLKEMYA